MYLYYGDNKSLKREVHKLVLGIKMSDKESETIDAKVKDAPSKKKTDDKIYEVDEQDKNPYYNNEDESSEEDDAVEEGEAQEETRKEIKEQIIYVKIGLPYQQPTNISAKDQEQRKVRAMRPDICSMNMVVYDLESRAA